MSGVGAEQFYMRRDVLVGVLSYFLPSRGNNLFSRFMPMQPVDADRVRMDVAKMDLDGMTPAVAPGSSSPAYQKRVGRSGVEFTAQSWREKAMIDAMDYRDLRRAGTHDEDMYPNAMAILAKYQRILRRRLENRFEYLRANAIMNGSVTYVPANQASAVTVNYRHPEFLSPTTSNTWGTAGGNILEDLAAWSTLLEDTAVGEKKTLVVPPSAMRGMRADADIVSLFQNRFSNLPLDQVTPLQGGASPRIADRAVQEAIMHFVGDMEVVVHSGYFTETREVVAAASAGGADLDVDDASLFTAGDELTISDRPAGNMEKLIVSSIAGNTITFTTNLPFDVQLGAMVQKKIYFMPQDKIAIIGGFEFSQLDEAFMALDGGFIDGENPIYPDTLGKLVSTRNTYLLDDRSPGFYSKITPDDDGDPPSAMIVSGADALPRIDYPETYVVGTIVAGG